MKKLIPAFLLFAGSLLFAQSISNEVYQSENYSIIHPQDWKVTNDSEIINIFPPNQIGAITIRNITTLLCLKQKPKNSSLPFTNLPMTKIRLFLKVVKKDILNIFTNILMKNKS
jgi:hypothetical protein